MAFVHCSCGFMKNNIPDGHVGKKAICPQCKGNVIVEKNEMKVSEQPPPLVLSPKKDKQEEFTASDNPLSKVDRSKVKKNNCIECGKAKKFLSVNYAGFDVKKEGKNIYPFIDRIQELILPGDKKEDFLCADCASKRKVICSSHGPVEDDNFTMGVPPSCRKCDKEKKSEKIKSCIECGKGKKMLSVNYAGFDVKKEGKNIYPFIVRIEELILPGDKKEDFLCADCASKRKVICSSHGPVEDSKFLMGIPPKCQKCDEEKKLLIEQEKRKEEEQQRVRRDILKKYNSIIESKFRENTMPVINSLININQAVLTDVPDIVWEEYSERFNMEDIIEDLVRIFNESTNFTFDEKNDFVNFHNHHLVKKLNANVLSPEFQEQLKEYGQKVAQTVIMKLSGTLETVTIENQKLITMEENERYELIRKIMDFCRIKDSSKHLLDITVDYLEEITDYPDEWWKEYHAEFDIDEVLKFSVHLIDRLFSLDELHILVNHITDYKSLIEKMDKCFVSPEIQSKLNLVFNKYNEHIIKEIIEDLTSKKIKPDFVKRKREVRIEKNADGSWSAYQYEMLICKGTYEECMEDLRLSESGARDEWSACIYDRCISTGTYEECLIDLNDYWEQREK